MANSSHASCEKALKSCMSNRFVLLLFQLLRWLPVVFILAVVGWSYYAYVIALCMMTVDNTFERVVMLILYHAVLLIFMWSYWQTVFAEMWSPPSQFVLSSDDLKDLSQNVDGRVQRDTMNKLFTYLPIQCRSFDGTIRICLKCQLIKPDRAHHCSVCDKCLLKMDHHCPWVNSCVHFGNYKYFILFLAYAWLLCLVVALTDLKYVILFWTMEGRMRMSSQFHIIFLFFVSAMFLISVSSIFFYHIWLTLKNRSTLEAFRAPVFVHGPVKDAFNRGYKENFIQVFGDKPHLWFLPIFTSLGDGVVYETNVRQRFNA